MESRGRPRRRALPSPIPAVRAHLGFAESPEVHRQVGLNAIHGSGQGDSAEQQHSQDHIGHRGCDPHNLERSQKVHARKGKKKSQARESHFLYASLRAKSHAHNMYKNNAWRATGNVSFCF